MKNRLMIVLLVVSLGINIGFLLHWFWPKIVPGATARATSGWHAGPMKHHLGLSSQQARLMENERRQVLAQAKPLQEALRTSDRVRPGSDVVAGSSSFVESSASVSDETA